MRKDFLNFLKAIFIFSFISALLVFIASLVLPEGEINHTSWYILFYFFLITVAFHFGLLRSSQGKPQAFIRFYMGATTLKLLIHVIVLLLYCLFNRDSAVHFIVTFLIMYIFYTAFEAVIAAKRFRK